MCQCACVEGGRELFTVFNLQPLTNNIWDSLTGLGEMLSGYEEVKDFVASLEKPR